MDLEGYAQTPYKVLICNEKSKLLPAQVEKEGSWNELGTSMVSS